LEKYAPTLFSNENEPNPTVIKLLHFAPEDILHPIFSSLSTIDYYPVDIDASRYNLRDVIDIQKINYADNMFDVIICSHVLEHVPDDHSAIKELFRVLKKNGTAFILVPIFYDLYRTYENPSYNTPELREEHFGHHDHVRKYGTDFSTRLIYSGFDVETINPKEVFNKYDYGLKKHMEVFIAKK